MNWKEKINQIIERLNFNEVFNSDTTFTLTKVKTNENLPELYTYLKLDKFKDITDEQKLWTVILLMFLLQFTTKNQIYRHVDIINILAKENFRNRLNLETALSILSIYNFIDIYYEDFELIVEINNKIFNQFIEGIPLPDYSRDIIESRKYINKLNKLDLESSDILTNAFKKITEDYAVYGKTKSVEILNDMEIYLTSKYILTYILGLFQANPERYYGITGYSVILNSPQKRTHKNKIRKALNKLRKKGIIKYKTGRQRIETYTVSLTNTYIRRFGLTEPDKNNKQTNKRATPNSTDNIPEEFMNSPFDPPFESENKQENEDENKTESNPQNEFLNLIKNNEIPDEKLFYNNDTDKKLRFYIDLLNHEDTDFENNNLIRGKIIIMLEGLPGTGKTAFANYLAKTTGRNIIHADWHTINDRFLGESEKRLKNMLDETDRILINSNRKPVAIFNEAESFLSSRIAVGQQSDKMGNTMVSMLLEWLEQRKPFGIVIFTANFVQLIDKAFERRITRIRFDMPDSNTRSKIWQYYIEQGGLDLDYSEFINYELTGAEIEKNIREYRLHKFTYNLKEEDAKILHNLCNSSKWVDNRPKVGFR